MIVPVKYYSIYLKGNYFEVWARGLDEDYNTEMGLYNLRGKKILPAIYRDINIGENQFTASIDGNSYIFNKKGKKTHSTNEPFIKKWLISQKIFPKEPEFTDVKGHIALLYLEKERYVLVDFKAKKIIGNKIYKGVHKHAVGVYGYHVNDKEGLINNGKEVIPPTYDNITDWGKNGSYFTVENKKRYGIVSKDGKLMIPLKYDFIYSNQARNNLCEAILDKKRGLISLDNKMILPVVFDDIDVDKSSEFVFVSKGKKYGVYDYQGNMLLDVIYDDISISPTDQVFTVKKDKEIQLKFYKRNKITKTLTLPKNYDNVWEFNQGLAIIKKSGKYGIINLKGEVVLAAKYDFIKDFDNRSKATWVTRNKVYGILSLPIKF